MTEKLNETYEAVVIGGGAAGLNGALMLARSRRSVLVIDAEAPRNAPAAGVHGLLGHDGLPPAELLRRGRTEVRGYGGHITTGEVVAAERDGETFTVRLADGRAVAARRLLVTTGLVDELPDIPGLRQRWGHEVLHCPYCHGWEVRDQAIGILASSVMSVHQALMFRQLSTDVVYFGNGRPLAADDARKLTAADITVVPDEVVAVEVTHGRLSGLRLDDGAVVARQAVAVATFMRARAGFLAGLGLAAVPHPSGMGEHVSADATGRTEVPGVWAAGNVTDLTAQVGACAAAGALAGAQINADLIMADLDARLATSSSLSRS